jgi:peroxiredoxin
MRMKALSARGQARTATYGMYTRSMAARRTLTLLSAGSRAPEFRLTRLEGGTAALGDLIAKGPCVLAFFKVSCPVCQLTFPFLERIHAAGLPVYGVSQNDAEETRDFSRYYGITFPALLDTEESGFPVSDAYGISSVPTMFLVDASGTIMRVLEGWGKADIEWLGRQAGISPFREGERVPEWKAG